MPIATAVITEASIEPVTLAEAILWSKGNIGFEDSLFDALISTATNQVESIIQHRLITHTSEMYYDSWPRDRCFSLWFPPTVTVNSLKYYDVDGTLQTWASSNYWVINNSKHNGYIKIKPSASVPTLENGRPQAIVINYDNGYGAAASSVPEDFKTAIKMFVTDLYDARKMHLADVKLTENPTAMQVLGCFAIAEVESVSLAQFTNVSGGYVY